MNYDDQKLSEEAIAYVKANRRVIIEKFCGLDKFPRVEHPISLFMAGSPGAGKTEFSKRLIGILFESYKEPIVRIDADEIRNMLPQYTGGNSYLFQAACSIGLEKLYDHVLSKRQHVIIDGTFANYSKSRSNVERSIRKNRLAQIFYVYQDPVVAWDFTKKREELEGRNIPKDAFIDEFFAARDNANKIKKEFLDRLILNFVQKNYKNNIEAFESDIDTIDKYIKISYTKDELTKSL